MFMYVHENAGYWIVICSIAIYVCTKNKVLQVLYDVWWSFTYSVH